MYLLFESPAGYALFQCDESKASTPDAINSLVVSQKGSPMKLKAFSKFESTSEALAETSMLIEGNMSDSLKKFLKKEVKKGSTLGVSDMKLAKAISKKLEIPLVSDASIVNEWTRGARCILPSLLLTGNKDTGVTTAEDSLKGTCSFTGSTTQSDLLGVMALGLAHSLSRFKLKFSSDRIDSMVIQAIALLDDLDKELNTYAMRLREWYGWHFPELTSVLTDPLAYARLIQSTGKRDQILTADLSALLPDDLEAKIKTLANLSMGTDLTDGDLDHIKQLSEQVISLSQYRTELSDYLRSRMQGIAPNTTALLGELVGARLIAHSGSLVGLAKAPASTLQLLGAEKALFRALKTRSPTPKYGLLFHSSMVGQASPRYKGKVARVLAAKAALSVRIDALARTEDDVTGQYTDGSFGQASRIKVEQRLRFLEKSSVVGASKKYSFVSPSGGNSVGHSGTAKEAGAMNQGGSVISAYDDKTVPRYDTSTDIVLGMNKKRSMVEEVPAPTADSGVAIVVNKERSSSRLKTTATAVTASKPSKKHKVDSSKSQDIDEGESKGKDEKKSKDKAEKKPKDKTDTQKEKLSKVSKSTSKGERPEKKDSKSKSEKK